MPEKKRRTPRGHFSIEAQVQESQTVSSEKVSAEPEETHRKLKAIKKDGSQKPKYKRGAQPPFD